jgi:selenocysteine lyase/cysteine desulfurase
VPSSTGEVADLDAVVPAAGEGGPLVVVAGSQAVGWLPVDASQVDAFACVGYKGLMSPRGSAFLALSERLQERLRPINAGWYAGADVHTSYYGPPLRLATDARRFDVSPAWFSWVGTAPALELLERIGIEQVRAHDVALADRFRAGLGLPAAGSAIVSTTVPDAAAKLERAGIRAATRAGALRASFHLYSTEADVDAALDALVG